LELFEAFKEAVEKRPDLQSERLRLEKQQIQLKYDLNQLFPSLDVFATWGLNGLDPHLGGALDDISSRNFPQETYGLSLSFPLTMWKERNNLKSTRMSKAQQIITLKKTEETIIQEVDFQIRLLRTTWETIPLRRAQTAYEEAALEAEKKRLDAGKSTSFNVLKIASDLTKARSDEIGTLRDYNQAISELNFRKGTTLERWHIDPPRRGGTGVK
jgi:outer membrane protein TolC